MAGQLDATSEDLAKVAAAGAIATLISGGGELFTLGADTPITVTVAGITGTAGSAALVTGGLAAGLRSYSAGNTTALGRFDANAALSAGAGAAFSKFGPLEKFSETVESLTDQAESIIEAEQENAYNE